MKVKITYPEDFVLKGWDKSLFDLALKRMFSNSCFWSHNLARLRKRIVDARAAQAAHYAPEESLDERARTAELADEMDLLFATEFAEMSPDVLEILPRKVGELLGVQVEWVQPKALPPALWTGIWQRDRSVSYGRVAVLGGGLVAAAAALALVTRPDAPSENVAPNPTTYLPGSAFSAVTQIKPPVGIEASQRPVRITPPSTECDGEEALCLSTQTPSPRDLMQKLAATLPASGAGSYSVVLKVVPLFEPADDAAPGVRP